MIELVQRLMSKSDLNCTFFNVELVYDEVTEQISIIEINPRMSYQFANSFSFVDGINTFEQQLLLLTSNQNIEWVPRKGKYRVAGSFVLRRFTDAFVKQIPNQMQIDHVQKQYPETEVKVLCHSGQRFRYAIVNTGGETWDQLYLAFEQVEKILEFQFLPTS